MKQQKKILIKLKVVLLTKITFKQHKSETYKSPIFRYIKENTSSYFSTAPKMYS